MNHRRYPEEDELWDRRSEYSNRPLPDEPRGHRGQSPDRERKKDDRKGKKKDDKVKDKKGKDKKDKAKDKHSGERQKKDDKVKDEKGKDKKDGMPHTDDMRYLGDRYQGYPDQGRYGYHDVPRVGDLNSDEFSGSYSQLEDDNYRGPDMPHGYRDGRADYDYDRRGKPYQGHNRRDSSPRGHGHFRDDRDRYDYYRRDSRGKDNERDTRDKRYSQEGPSRDEQSPKIPPKLGYPLPGMDNRDRGDWEEANRPSVSKNDGESIGKGEPGSDGWKDLHGNDPYKQEDQPGFVKYLLKLKLIATAVYL